MRRPSYTCASFFCRFFLCQCLHWIFFFNAMSFAVQSSVCPPVTLPPCLCVPFSPSPPVHVRHVQSVGVVCVAVCGCVCVVLLCVVVCACVLLWCVAHTTTHSNTLKHNNNTQQHTTTNHTHTTTTSSNASFCHYNKEYHVEHFLQGS